MTRVEFCNGKNRIKNLATWKISKTQKIESCNFGVVDIFQKFPLKYVTPVCLPDIFVKATKNIYSC